MYKKCKTVQSCERQKEFEQTLIRMMEHTSYEEVTVSALCREMGVPRKAFYRYFDRMEDVLDALVDEMIDAAFLRIEVKAKLEVFFEYWKKQAYLLDVLEKNDMSQKLMDRALTFIITSEHMEAMTGTEMKYAGYVAAILTLVIMWHHTGMKKSVEEMKALTMEMFVQKIEVD